MTKDMVMEKNMIFLDLKGYIWMEEDGMDIKELLNLQLDNKKDNIGMKYKNI